MTTLSVPRTGSYYIYSFDGRLLAEYDIYGACLKDYIYMGGRLVAEYVPATGQYFYYMQDQIGSTRVVTNDSGTMVYAEAHDPYGGIQKTWVNTFDPKRKFSDKERDAESGLDYFGARYYNNPSYRWISVDPVISPSAISNPQDLNLYSYSRNNPTTFFDPDGRCVIGLGFGLALAANIISSYVMMHELLNYLYGYISTQRALNMLINKPITGAEAWVGTPYEKVGDKSERLLHGDCAGILWRNISGGGFDYKYVQANQKFILSLIEGGINEGILDAIPKGWAPQAGDVGYWDGHVCMYAYREGGVDYVYNASKAAGIFHLQRLDNIVNEGFHGVLPVWFRLRR
jgi:RHS repeat-associated protein